MSEYPPLSSIMHEEWAQALAPVEPQIRAMGDFLRTEHAAGHRRGRHFPCLRPTHERS